MDHDWEEVRKLDLANRYVHLCLNCSMIRIIDYGIVVYILNGKYFDSGKMSCGEILMRNALE